MATRLKQNRVVILLFMLIQGYLLPGILAESLENLQYFFFLSLTGASVLVLENPNIEICQEYFDVHFNKQGSWFNTLFNFVSFSMKKKT